MSFSTEVKQELVSLRIEKSCCMLSELNALTQSCASMTLHERGQVSIAFSSENVTVAKRVFILLKKRLEINATPHFNKVERFGGRRVCLIRLSQGATRAMMHDENILAQRSLHESVLRATNCDHSNMLRQLSAAQRQISALQYLEARSLLAALPPALRETAELRLKNPDASLEQLGEMLDPPLGKSGVNHRLRKIMQYAQASGAPVLNGDDQNDDPEAVPQA